MHPSRFILAAVILSAFSLAACSQPNETPVPDSTLSLTTALPQPEVMATRPPNAATSMAEPASPVPTPTEQATVPPSPSVSVPPSPVSATSFPNPDLYTWAEVATGLASPVGFAHAGDERLFILERGGRIRTWQDGELKPEPFLEITDRVGAGGERGLLGLAFHPNYAETGTFYVNYTDRNGDTHIAQFSVRPDNPDQADPASEKQLLFVKQPFPNHNGGALAFGPDGYLYIGLGDGGSAGDPFENGQSVDTLLGKILRIDVNGGDPYAIPAGNPLTNGEGLPEIWAYGLRNPWRFAFDRQTGDLYIGDVGQNQHEEIDFQPAASPGGENYGWNIFEGNACYASDPCSEAGLTAPIYTYTHAEAGCSVTGGVVYRGAAIPEWQGIYLFGDYCSGMVGGLLPPSSPDAIGGWQHAWLFNGAGNISSFGEDSAGEVYLADLNGTVYQLRSK